MREETFAKVSFGGSKKSDIRESRNAFSRRIRKDKASEKRRSVSDPMTCVALENRSQFHPSLAALRATSLKEGGYKIHLPLEVKNRRMRRAWDGRTAPYRGRGFFMSPQPRATVAIAPFALGYEPLPLSGRAFWYNNDFSKKPLRNPYGVDFLLFHPCYQSVSPTGMKMTNGRNDAGSNHQRNNGSRAPRPLRG